MGLWYEIARYDHRFERGLMEVTATYTSVPMEQFALRIGDINVIHLTIFVKQPLDTTKIPDPAQPGKLKVSFFLNFYSDYYVMELDQENYNYALIAAVPINISGY